MSENERKSNIVSRLPRWLRAALFALLQWTWGLPQNLLGLLVLLILGKQERFTYHGALVTLFGKHPIFRQTGAFSLGTFIFIPRTWDRDFIKKVVVHEYGHSVQSLILGPLYLPAVGLPSVIWSSAWGRSIRRAKPLRGESGRGKPRLYTSKYPENWANALGQYATGDTPSRH